jgi:hypothetical protein
MKPDTDDATAKQRRLAKSEAKHKALHEARGNVVTYEITANGRHIEPRTELSIQGEDGRFLFQRHIRTPSGLEWIDCLGPDSAGFRSFRPSRIKTVHRINKTRANEEAA